MSEIMLVKAENEDLRAGKTVTALACDDHKLHWLEHRAILGNPEARNNPQLIQTTLTHMVEHQQMSMQLQIENPQLLAWMGETPMPMPMKAPQQMGAMVNPQNPVEKQAENVNAPSAPNMPKNADMETKGSYEKQQATQQQQ